MNNNDQKKWQGELRRSLEREAFNEKHKCFICSKKENLHVHHLIYTENKKDFFNPKYWRVLCMSCHAQTPKPRKQSKKSTQSKIISLCDYCGKIIKTPHKRKYCDYCLLVHHFKWSHEEYVRLYGNSKHLIINDKAIGD